MALRLTAAFFTFALLTALPLTAQQSKPADSPTPPSPTNRTSQDAELETRLAELKTKAEQGDLGATQQVYTAYALAGHTDQARSWAALYEEQLTRLAESGDAKAMMLLASSYLKGQDYMPQDPAKAVTWFTRAAEAGQPSAAYILGEIFSGHNNSHEAERFYKQAYEAYCAMTADIDPANLSTEQRNALYWQGYMELMGQGIPRQENEAIRKLILADNEWAWGQLYRCYIKGIGVEKDPAKAIDYAHRLADNAQDGTMAWVVGSAYLKGDIVEKNEEIGRQYLDRAAAANIPSAIYHKALLLQQEGNYKEAYNLFNQAASMGLPEAMTATALLLLNGAEGVEKDDARALNMLRVASDRYNDLRAPYELGRYYDSVGEPSLADEWYLIASNRGVTEAMARRGLMHIKLNSPVSWSPTEMYRWWKVGSDAGNATCRRYLNLFLYVAIPLILIITFGVPIFVVNRLNKRAMMEEEQQNHADS